MDFCLLEVVGFDYVVIFPRRDSGFYLGKYI